METVKEIIPKDNRSRKSTTSNNQKDQRTGYREELSGFKENGDQGGDFSKALIS